MYRRPKKFSKSVNCQLLRKNRHFSRTFFLQNIHDADAPILVKWTSDTIPEESAGQKSGQSAKHFFPPCSYKILPLFFKIMYIPRE